MLRELRPSTLAISNCFEPKMGIYAVFGVSQTFTYFFVMCVLALLTFYSSRRLFRVSYLLLFLTEQTSA